MKTIITLGVGFWLGRQIYINYDKQEALNREQHIKKRLFEFLDENKFSTAASKKHAQQILGK